MSTSRGYFMETAVGGGSGEGDIPASGRSSYHLDLEAAPFVRRSRNPKPRRQGCKLKPNRRIISKRVRRKHRRARRAS